MKTSKTCNEKWNSFLHLLINWTSGRSARSAYFMLFINDENTLSFFNFLIVELCNSLANCWCKVDVAVLFIFVSTSFPAVFYQEIIDTISCWCLSYFGHFAISKTVSRDDLSETVILAKSLK